MAAHDIPYVAQASPHNYRDLMTKAKKAFAADGPAVLNVLAPCPRGWRHDERADHGHRQAGRRHLLLAAVRGRERQDDGQLQAHGKAPVAEWLKARGASATCSARPTPAFVEEIQAKVDQEWEQLLKDEANSLGGT